MTDMMQHYRRKATRRKATRRKATRRKVTGFTLVELIIAVLIVGILASIAIPTYQENVVLRGLRADAKAFLLDMASRQERFFSQYVSYTGKVSAGTSCTGIDCGLGLKEDKSPQGDYKGTVTLGPSSCAPGKTSCRTYVLSAVPESNRAKGDSKCGTLTLNSAGIKGANGKTELEDEDMVHACWR